MSAQYLATALRPTAGMEIATSRLAALIGWVEAHAHTRYWINGDVAVVDAEGIVAAAFGQHTS